MPLKRLSNSPGAHALGAMRHRITLYEPGLPGFDGGAVPDSPVLTCWAEVRALRGEELAKVQTIVQGVEHLVSIPFQRGVNENQLVAFEGRKFQIHYVEDREEGKLFLDLYCEELGQNAGQQTAWAAPPPPGTPPVLPGPSGAPATLAWTPYTANGSVPAGVLVGIRADGGVDGITLALDGEEGELLYALNETTAGGVVHLVDRAGAPIGNAPGYDLVNPNQTVALAYTAGKWGVFGG